MSTITITITIDGDNITVSTGAGGASARRSEPMAEPTGRLATGGDTSIRMPGKKGTGNGSVADAEDDDLAWWRKKLTASLAAEPDGQYAGHNRKQLDAIETEIGRRVRQGGGPSPADDDFPPDDFGGGGSGGAGGDDEIPFAPWTLP